MTWRILVFFAGWTLLTAPLIIPAVKKYAPNGGATPLGLRRFIEIVSVVGILIVAWLMLHFLDRRPLASLGFARRYAVGDILFGLIMGLGMMTACIAVLYFCGWAKPDMTFSFSGRR
jgi:hypothetical protein